jgi:RimJ/RimL family protein N-acetyltransferase
VGTHIRRVGFRHGSDDELTALHVVESEVEAERRPDRVPQPLDAYIAFARNLPAQFHDHTWVVEDDDGTPIATGACWWNAAGDGRTMEVDLFVRRPWRRRGIASDLLRQICAVTLDEQRSLLTWSTFDAVPAGDAMSTRLGARPGLVSRTSELLLAGVDWAMVDRWIAEGPRRAPGYRIDTIISPLPPELYEDAATFHHIMNTQPRGDLDVGDVLITADDAASVDRSIIESGRGKWTMFVRDPDGTLVGGTEVTFEPWEPTVALQQNTGIHPAHRGRGLAKWAKAAMLDRLRAHRPEIVRVRTGNAFSNAPMLAINDALGFRVTASRTEWQAFVADVIDVL